MKSIKVLHVIGSLGLGGAQVCLKHLVENSPPNIENYVYPLRSKPDQIKINAKIIKNKYFNYDPRKIFTIIKLCKKYDIDIIHAHLDKPVIACLLASFFCKSRLIVHEHGPIFSKSLRSIVYRIALRLFKKRVSRFIAVSNAAAEQIQLRIKVPSEEISVIYNSVDLDIFKPNPAIRKSIRLEFGLDDSDIAIGFVGRLDYLKGPDILLAAFAKLKKNFSLFYLGTGSMQEDLKLLADDLGVSERVIFLGYREDVADIMNAFDVGAITSRQDAFPLVPLELLAMKIPLVSCNVYGLAEVVENMQNALVPIQNTPEQIAECIERIISEDNLRGDLINSGVETAEKFSVGRYINNLNDVYRLLYKYSCIFSEIWKDGKQPHP